MKKMLCLVMVLMLIGAVSPMVLAEDVEIGEDVEIDEETQEEVKIMENYTGGELRLLQLEKSIAKNIVKGETIISNLNDSNLTVNTSLLEAIVAELKLVKEEVKDVDTNSSDVVQIFIDLKSDARNLTKDFRDTLHSLIDNETAIKLRTQIRARVNSNGTVENLGQKIKKCVRTYNAHRLQKMYNYTGSNNNSLVERYKNGNCTAECLRENVSKHLGNMSNQKRYQLLHEIKNSSIQRWEHARKCVENATNGFFERKQQRFQERLDKIQGSGKGFGQQVKEHMDEKLDEIKGKTGGGKQNKGSNNPGKGGNKGV